ncbi:MAG: hypothetical protein QOH25_612 [Acidobacteriota bacterium]|jgi:hypothetical protein|nr:hypothetical protein [Acidobacteriota bacterium]
MKKLQQFCAIVALILAIALPAFAGDIPCPGVIDKSPSQQSSVMGDISAPGVVALDPFTEITLSLLQSILSIF